MTRPMPCAGLCVPTRLYRAVRLRYEWRPPTWIPRFQVGYRILKERGALKLHRQRS